MKKRCTSLMAIGLFSISLFAEGGSVSTTVVSNEANELMDALSSSRSIQVSRRVEGDLRDAMKYVTFTSKSGELVVSCRRWLSDGKTTNISAVCDVTLPEGKTLPL